MCQGKSANCLRSKTDEAASRFKPRALLTETDAIQIYMHRRNSKRSAESGKMVMQMATKFNVSPKAIRDIWSRRTWAPETQHLWTQGEVAMVRVKNSKPKSSDSSRSDQNSGHSPRNSGRPRMFSQIRNNKATIAAGSKVSTNTLSWSMSSPANPERQQSICSHVALLPPTMVDMKSLTIPFYAQENWSIVPLQAFTSRSSCQSSHLEQAEANWNVSEDVGFVDPFHDDWPYW
jgi:hypothetical protein